MTEKEAINKTIEISNIKDKYIILSWEKADMLNGMSVPFIGALPEGERIIYIYDSYDKAKTFFKKYGDKNIVENYPIGKIEEGVAGISFFDILKIAKNMGATGLDFNITEEDAFGADISWFLDVNNQKDSSIAILMTKNEFDKIGDKNDIVIRFNPMKIYNFYDPYNIDDEKKQKLLRLVFDAGETIGDYKNTYSNLDMIECLMLLDYVATKFIPSAAQQKKVQDVEYFKSVELILQEVVWKKIKNEKHLYTAIEADGKIMIKNNCMYVFITSMYEKMGHYRYKRIENHGDIIKMAEDSRADKIIVTDGPRYLGIIPTDNLKKFIF